MNDNGIDVYNVWFGTGYASAFYPLCGYGDFYFSFIKLDINLLSILNFTRQNFTREDILDVFL